MEVDRDVPLLREEEQALLGGLLRAPLGVRADDRLPGTWPRNPFLSFRVLLGSLVFDGGKKKHIKQEVRKRCNIRLFSVFK